MAVDRHRLVMQLSSLLRAGTSRCLRASGLPPDEQAGHCTNEHSSQRDPVRSLRDLFRLLRYLAGLNGLLAYLFGFLGRPITLARLEPLQGSNLPAAEPSVLFQFPL